MSQKRWIQSADRKNYTVKLAELALRAQRLLVAQKIDNMAGLVAMHASALKEHPDLLQQIEQALKESKTTLRNSPMPRNQGK